MSLNGPLIIMASVEVRVKQLTAQPNCNFERPNSGSIKRITPEITEASKPIRKPPKATINETLATKPLLFFISIFLILFRFLKALPDEHKGYETPGRLAPIYSLICPKLFYTKSSHQIGVRTAAYPKIKITGFNRIFHLLIMEPKFRNRQFKCYGFSFAFC